MSNTEDKNLLYFGIRLLAAQLQRADAENQLSQLKLQETYA